MLVAILFAVALGLVFALAKDTNVLMPGPLTSAHATIESCNACHTQSGSDKLSWMKGLVAGDRHADSQACLSCHKMPASPFNQHGVPTDVLTRSTDRLTKIAAASPTPHAARAQSLAFPVQGIVTRGLYCATCHQEHQGSKFDLKKITEEQCRSCHVVKFDGFDGNHPQFDHYPFKRRTRIIYDHAGHFGKHFPEVAKKDPQKVIPATCATCHDTSKDKRVMGVAPFEQTCASCHQNQITGQDRVSGPKGIAFLSLPGFDVATLKKKKVLIGEWPETSEAGLTPFMKLMISRSARGRAAIKLLSQRDLQDLSSASPEQIEAAATLIWEIKGIFHALIKGKASDMLAGMDGGGGMKLSAAQMADLTASLPRDLLVGAHQQWLPNLGREMANRQQLTAGHDEGGWITTTAATRLAIEAGEAATQVNDNSRAGVIQKSGERRTAGTVEIKAETDGGQGDAKSSRAQAAKPSSQAGSGGEQPKAKATNQADDLLFPTEEELRTFKGRLKGARPSAQPGGQIAKPAPSTSEQVRPGPSGGGSKVAVQEPEPQNQAAPASDIKGDVDPDAWADHGGWYRQDYAIFYRPTGHKDKLIQSWLSLGAPHVGKGAIIPAAAIFDGLTAKDAQGACTKCHSVDEIPGKGRTVNFSPTSVESKRGRFTNFSHEPHFGIVGNEGCLTCHKLEGGRPYLESYERGNPQSFVSNFGDVKKEQCQTCHTSGKARQDCLTCHKYHVNGVSTPIVDTKNPAQ